MANCCDMKEGDLYVCNSCGLELEVKKACGCKPGSADACKCSSYVLRQGDVQKEHLRLAQPAG